MGGAGGSGSEIHVGGVVWITRLNTCSIIRLTTISFVMERAGTGTARSTIPARSMQDVGVKRKGGHNNGN